MADGLFTRARGSAHQLSKSNPNALAVVLLKANETEADLIKHDTVSEVLAEAGNTEADFTSYARKTGLTVTIDEDDVNDEVTLDIQNQTWSPAGGASNNTLTKALICVSVGAGDANLIPLAHYDFAPTTDGSDLILQLHADGFYRST